MPNIRNLFSGLFLSCALLFAAFCFSGCSGSKEPGQEKKTESTNRGEITVAIDESLKPVMEQQLNVFDSSYPDVTIHRKYLSENECIEHLYGDSARLIMITRDISQEEKKAFAESNSPPIRSLAVAEDAVAFIVSNASKDSLMTVDQLKAILTDSFARPYTIVFDNPRSGIVNYILDSLIPGQKLSSKTYAVENNEAVIKYVEEHENALGVLGVSHVYDPQDESGAGRFRKNIKVVSFKDESTGIFYQPYQAYIALGQYPFTRQVYFVSRESWQGPATGFANFLSSERGQLIFNKARLLPLRVQLTIREAAIKQ